MRKKSVDAIKSQFTAQQLEECLRSSGLSCSELDIEEPGSLYKSNVYDEPMLFQPVPAKIETLP